MNQQAGTGFVDTRGMDFFFLVLRCSLMMHAPSYVEASPPAESI